MGSEMCIRDRFFTLRVSWVLELVDPLFAFLCVLCLLENYVCCDRGGKLFRDVFVPHSASGKFLESALSNAKFHDVAFVDTEVSAVSSLKIKCCPAGKLSELSVFQELLRAANVFWGLHLALALGF